MRNLKNFSIPRNNRWDKIISIVDIDARATHKSPGNMKRGYKNHIIVDEDSEIILASVQIPFNVNDGKKLIDLIEKVEENLEIKPNEISTDKVYGATDNRAYLKDNEIISNIDFYKKSSRKLTSFGLQHFIVSDTLDYVICQNDIKETRFRIKNETKYQKEFKVFMFDQNECNKCKFKNQCLKKDKKGRIIANGKSINVPIRYDAIITDRKRTETKAFKNAINARMKIERRFATLVINHGLGRCRLVRLKRTKIHITMANMSCNIIRMMNLLLEDDPNISVA